MGATPFKFSLPRTAALVGTNKYPVHWLRGTRLVKKNDWFLAYSRLGHFNYGIFLE